MADPMLRLKTAFNLQNVSPRSVATLAKALGLKRPFSLREVIVVSKIDAAIKSFEPPAKAWIAVAVIQGGLKAVRYYKGKELARDGQPNAPNADTFFYMGSITKTFTSALLARTIEKSADDHIPIKLTSLILKLTAGSLPPEVYAAAYPWSLTLTLGELARHQAGLPKNSASNPRVEVDPDAFAHWTYVRLFMDLYKLRAPDFSIDYSNFGIQLLGWSLALWWHTPWERLLATEITTPLGMTKTKVYEDLSESQRNQIAPPDDLDELNDAARYHGYPIPESNKLPGAAKAYYTTNPSGYLLTTGPDMLKWLTFNLGLAGSPRDSLLGIMFTPAAKSDSEKSLGWKTKSSGASLTFYKSGGHGDYHGQIRFSPTAPKGVFLITNRDFDTAGLLNEVWSAVF